LLLQYKGVYARGIVSWDDLHHAVMMPLIETECGSIVDSGFENHCVAGDMAQALFSRHQQLRAKTTATAGGEHVNGNDVTHSTPAGFGDDETSNAWFLSSALGDYGERSPVLDVGCQLPPRVGNAGRKAPLVDAPQDLEILSSILSQGKFHSVILSGSARSGLDVCRKRV
jgi:hypothetical protein